jgi:hypothetical protein
MTAATVEESRVNQGEMARLLLALELPPSQILQSFEQFFGLSDLGLQVQECESSLLER